ncbi:type VII secretion integral membrane protein EccD [Phytohabitans sp. ZYX-F-186]|uniref:Type VII secretion integral membrane protein EccD n=1 Tax=Phytohabitans maris TaxID=3071409 RepID=A0ABU0ZK72_9ACTN|nr:type VII secretion integral membrane protein EccD [Phytohabitans sp. ZYX-F-186]MDQ7906921.1 type VII secretion integral membrane protein EccD [Phytohabitans sp. ZYX-F-186]
MTTGLARVTISTPRRRLDVALPEQVPVAELLPEVLRHAGDGLADDGERHGGWVLRRADGAALSAGQALSPQGVRDGELLFLLPARIRWAEPEYDDVVEAIADGARRRGASWSPAATRIAGLAAAAVPLAAGLAAAVRAAPQWKAVPPVAAALLLAAGVVAARSRRDGLAGATLAGYALPYAFVAAVLPVTAGRPAQVAAGSAALLVASLLGAVGVGAYPRVFVAGGAVGLLGGLAALAALGGLTPHGAAAVLLALLACGVGVLPLLAIRLGRLPLPPVAPPSGDSGPVPRPEPARVDAAVGRTEEALTGLLLGHAALAVAASGVLVASGGPAGRLLVGVVAAGLLLRARLFAATHHRVPLLAAGLGGTAVLGGALLVTTGPPVLLALAAGGTLAALAVAAAGVAYAHRPPSPYLGRAADVLDTALVVCVVPVACAVLDVYAAVRDL